LLAVLPGWLSVRAGPVTLPKNSPHAARSNWAFSAADEPATADDVVSCTDGEPNQSPDKSSVLQAVSSGRKAAALIQPHLCWRVFLVVAGLIFTRHLIIFLSRKVISFLCDKDNRLKKTCCTHVA
jgi:hypothetical protein